MQQKSVSLSEGIAQIFEQRPELLELLQNKFGNISAISKSIHAEIEALVGRRLTVGSVGMALRRQLSRYPQKKGRSEKIPAPFEISTRNGLYELAIRRSEMGRVAIERVRQSIAAAPGNLFSSIEGQYEIVIIANQCNKTIIRRALKKERVTSEVDNIACVTTNWAPNTKDIPGIYYRVTQALALRRISIQSFHTIGAEMSVFVKEDVLGDAHQALTLLLMG